MEFLAQNWWWAIPAGFAGLATAVCGLCHDQPFEWVPYLLMEIDNFISKL